jgi:hypothetical protein
MASKQKVRDDGNLYLPLSVSGQEEVQYRGVFSGPYIKTHFRRRAEYPSKDLVDGLYHQAKRLWTDNYAAMRNRDEAFTRTQFIDPILRLLGWHFITETHMPKFQNIGTRKRPDYCLFTTSETLSSAAVGSDLDLYRATSTVLEAKRCQHNLDDVSRNETKGWFPSQQIQDYLAYARDGAGKRFFNWAILTNGNEWRLYTERGARDAYFSLQLAQGESFCGIETFRQFVALFRAESFVADEAGRILLDDIHQQSLSAQANLETNLRGRIFNVLEDLGSAFLREPRNGLSEADFEKVYHHSLIFLYRLLFILYAESRDLLPIGRDRRRGSSHYLTQYSLQHLVSQLRDRAAFASNDDDRIYVRLLDLFGLIDGADERRNNLAGVSRFNGGLFDLKLASSLAPELDQWRIGDKDLGNIIRQLVFAQPPASGRQRQQTLATEETIDYATLEVRQLGDIYEGLLGAHFAKDPQTPGQLELRNQSGQNHRQGIFYTPDWVVLFLVRQTLRPLLDEIENSDEVQRAVKGKSEEAIKNDSFAKAVLALDLCDPAMGSGHFLVRSTEFLAEKIFNHPTTRLKTEKIVPGQRSASDIKKSRLIPVHPGLKQDDAEIAYWRRRVVESCIYGVDLNPMAVELAKLSLWLTCIATDEPLNFLDHHLMQGNTLLYTEPETLDRAPNSMAGDNELFDLREAVSAKLAEVIQTATRIESQPNTELDRIKELEKAWGRAQENSRTLLDTADLWLAIADGAPVQAEDYLLLQRHTYRPQDLNDVQQSNAEKIAAAVTRLLPEYQERHQAFHWHLRFPGVFFDDSGQALPPERAGFDAILGNPPYISTQTQTGGGDPRQLLDRKFGYADDLYVHFTDLGFRLLRPGGGFGFIVSDTFFTLGTKERMREMLQENTLRYLGQCDPFDATVDAAIFVAEKGRLNKGVPLTFIQARPRREAGGKRTRPEEFLPDFHHGAVKWQEAEISSILGREARHALFGSLRVHSLPAEIYQDAHKRAYFEPLPGTLRLLERFNQSVKKLIDQWWPRIETSAKFAASLPALRKYHATLKPGQVTLVGLIAEGGQGMRTANNARFIAYLAGTPQARRLAEKAAEWHSTWLADDRIRETYKQRLYHHGGDPGRTPEKQRAAWEAAVHDLRAEFSAVQLGFSKMDLLRIAPQALIADETDYRFAFETRRRHLLKHWQEEPQLADLWRQGSLEVDLKKLAKSAAKDDAGFCKLCGLVQSWFQMRNEELRAKKEPMLSRAVLGLRSSESYDDPSDVNRIATIYAGLAGKAIFVPFRKGDPTGNRWLDNEPLFIEWTQEVAQFMFSNSGRKAPNMPVIRNAHLYLTPGITWSAVGNHVSVKARYQEPCAFDADSMRLTPILGTIDAEAFLAIFNSDIFSFLKMKFVKHTAKWEIGDMRQIPLVLPTPVQESELAELARQCMAMKRSAYASASLDQDQVASVRAWARRLQQEAPAYLRPSAQMNLAVSPDDCLTILERAVSWRAEVLYGVEGEGPFDDF